MSSLIANKVKTNIIVRTILRITVQTCTTYITITVTIIAQLFGRSVQWRSLNLSLMLVVVGLRFRCSCDMYCVHIASCCVFIIYLFHTHDLCSCGFCLFFFM